MDLTVRCFMGLLADIVYSCFNIPFLLPPDQHLVILACLTHVCSPTPSSCLLFRLHTTHSLTKSLTRNTIYALTFTVHM